MANVITTWTPTEDILAAHGDEICLKCRSSVASHPTWTGEQVKSKNLSPDLLGYWIGHVPQVKIP